MQLAMAASYTMLIFANGYAIYIKRKCTTLNNLLLHYI